MSRAVIDPFSADFSYWAGEKANNHFNSPDG